MAKIDEFELQESKKILDAAVKKLDNKKGGI